MRKYGGAKDSDLAHFFWRWSQIEKHVRLNLFQLDCHVIYCCIDKSYPCLVGIGLSKEELTSQDLLGLSHL